MSHPISERTVDYLIIGGGLAAATAAETLRTRDDQATILMVTQEDYLPYHRPPLSKEYLRAEIPAEGIYGEGGIFFKQPQWFDDQRIEIVRSVSAESLDLVGKTVTLSDGSVVHYLSLLIATGAQARHLEVPGKDFAGVHVLRTLTDADAIREELEEGHRVVVVGTGFIGLETAADAITKKANVTVVGHADRFWDSVINKQLSQHFQDQFTQRGAILKLGYDVTGFTLGPSDRVASVQITNVADKSITEDIPCDLVIIGVGTQLNTELARAAGLEIDPQHGIVVDERLETRSAGVFVAGDVAAYPDAFKGRMHFEHWDNAIATGQVAAANMSGGDEPYRHIPYFFSDQFDYSINMLGYAVPQAQTITRGDMATNTFTAFSVQDGVMVAAFMVNDDAQMDTIRTLIATQVVIANPQLLADPAFDLASLVQQS